MAIQWASAFAKLLDPYDLKARLFPGLLVIVPIVAFVALLYGPSNPTVATLTSILITCGGPYVLASVVRTRGQIAQARLFEEWGAQPSTILLRHRDSRLPPQTKGRYHKLAVTKLGMTMPLAHEEAATPAAADQAYAAVADALRPLTNDKAKFPFVFKELVAYGFNRNAYGVRWVGVAVCVLAAFITFAHAGALVRPQAALELDLPHSITVLVSVVLLLLWILHFNAKTVEHASYSYALRLWEALERIAKQPGRQPA